MGMHAIDLHDRMDEDLQRESERLGVPADELMRRALAAYLADLAECCRPQLDSAEGAQASA